MPANGDRSRHFAAQSEMTAIYRAGFIQELLWVLKAATCPDEDMVKTPTLSENSDGMSFSMKGAPSPSILTPCISLAAFWTPRFPVACTGHRARDALEGKGPQRWPQRRLDRRLEGVAKAVGGGYCRLQMPLKLALGVRRTVAGHRLGTLEGPGGQSLTPPAPRRPLVPHSGAAPQQDPRHRGGRRLAGALHNPRGHALPAHVRRHRAAAQAPPGKVRGRGPGPQRP